jgi:tetratricopeptide (TPR) repeat protein
LRELDGIDSDARWLGAYEGRYWSRKAWAYHRLEKYQEELELAQLRLEHNSGDRRAWYYRFRALAGLGRSVDVGRLVAMEHENYVSGRAIVPELTAHSLGEEHQEIIQEINQERLSRLEARPETAVLPHRLTAGLRSNDRDDEWHYEMGDVLAVLDRLDEAAEHLRSIPRESPRWLDAAGELGWVLARLGEHDEARRLSTELEAIDEEAWRLLLQARIAAALGEKDRAVGLIARMPTRMTLHQEILFESLFGYPPFEELQRPRG